ncbi:hypothetical protein AO284_01995 [Pseudomonas sp. NZIPFR-PS2]|nr:hypothetical protein AO284_01995 [Pseudomonas sp. NZIPFR-PS2]
MDDQERIVPISDELVARVNDEPIPVARQVCRDLTREIKSFNGENADSCLEFVLFFTSLKENKLFDFVAAIPEIKDAKIIKGQTTAFCNALTAELDAIITHETALARQREIEARFTRGIDKSFGYEFTGGDFTKLQDMVNRLRELISNCADLGADHKLRMLKRLERLQSEMHKKVSSLDQFYNLAIEASVVARIVGENAKPIADIAKAIMGIAWRTQSHTVGLPSDTQAPMLTHDVELPNIE